MCGILVIVDKTQSSVDENRAENALLDLKNRGPDVSFSMRPRPYVFIGQTVLSLVGNIPDDKSTSNFVSDSGRYLVSFHGEIYNYRDLEKRFLGGQYLPSNVSDTAVLSKLHDHVALEQVPELLDGMYAYAVFDHDEDCLSIVRDIAGEKSLYVYEDKKFLIIASQISAIRAFGVSMPLNLGALQDYFHSRHFLQRDATAFLNVRQLLPGTIEKFDIKSGKLILSTNRSLRDWVSPTMFEEYGKLGVDELAEILDGLISSCVRQMIPINRKYASVVSGGIDSSLIASYLCEQSDPDLLVAVNHVGKDYISDELDGFRKCLGRDISVLDVTVEQYTARINASMGVLGSPLLSHSFIGQNIQSEFVNACGCRALFGGEGADELFGGYECYLNPEEDSTTNPSPYSGFIDGELQKVPPASEGYFEMLSAEWQRSLDAYKFIPKQRERTLLSQMLLDLSLQVANVGLRGADLMSMMWSVETRSVFVRKPIIQFALNLPLLAKIDPECQDPLMRTKTVLKKVFLRRFPQGLIQKKQGFSGFPNEAGGSLGKIEDFQTVKLLGLDCGQLDRTNLTRDQLWKYFNLEFFLRSLNEQTA